MHANRGVQMWIANFRVNQPLFLNQIGLCSHNLYERPRSWLFRKRKRHINKKKFTLVRVRLTAGQPAG